jgi:hypothetical protein
MDHAEDRDEIALARIEHTIRKTTEESAPDAASNLGIDLGCPREDLELSVQGVEKVESETDLLLFVPVVGFADLTPSPV